MKIAHVEASNIVPSLVPSQLSKNVPEKVVGNALKMTYSRTYPKKMRVGLKSFMRG